MRPEIVLASASPRRLEILKMFRLNPVVSVSDVEEKVEEGLTPDKIVIGLSCIKGEAVAPRYPEALVVSADTVVAYEGKILGKPRGEREAYEMLKSLSGTSHEVYTGYSMFFGGRCVSRAVRTVVKFKKLSDYEIKEYIKTGEPFDKAGGYGAQGMAAAFVEGIDGDFFNVVGFPLSHFYATVKEEFGIELL